MLYTPNLLPTLQQDLDSDELDTVRESNEDEYFKPCQRDEFREVDVKSDALL